MATLTIRGHVVTQTGSLWQCRGDVPSEGALLRLREPTNPVIYKAGKSTRGEGDAFTMQLYSASATPTIAPDPHWILDFEN